MFPASSHNGQAVLAFPDVCKTPSPGAPTPIAYPNIAMATGGTKTATKPSYSTKPAYGTKPAYKVSGDEAGALRRHLTGLHQKLMTMPGGNTTQWHAVLDEYVMTTAEVYKSLSNR